MTACNICGQPAEGFRIVGQKVTDGTWTCNFCVEKYANRQDNYGQPRISFVRELQALDDAAFQERARQSIFLSAYAGNNPRSDYHWHADACYNEAFRRGRLDLYDAAYMDAKSQCRL